MWSAFARIGPRLPVTAAGLGLALLAGCAGDTVYSLGPQEIRQEAARDLAGPPAAGPSVAAAQTRDGYPNINVPPEKPEGTLLTPAEQAEQAEQLRGAAADNGGTPASEERRLTAAERDLLRRQREVQARHEADRALLCEPRAGEPPAADCR